MTALFSSVGSFLDKRQLSVVWMPLLAFLGGLGVVVVTGIGPKVAQSWWSGASAELKTAAGGALVVVTVLLGQTLNAWRTNLIRLFSGYWPDAPGLRRGRDALAARHVQAQAKRVAADPELFLSYPRRSDQVLPTRLGNIIRAAEQHADRYGIDGVTAWPRLYVVLPASFVEAFATTAAAMEGAAVISVLGATFAVVGGVLAAALLPSVGRGGDGAGRGSRGGAGPSVGDAGRGAVRPAHPDGVRRAPVRAAGGDETPASDRIPAGARAVGATGQGLVPGLAGRRPGGGVALSAAAPARSRGAAGCAPTGPSPGAGPSTGSHHDTGPGAGPRHDTAAGSGAPSGRGSTGGPFPSRAFRPGGADRAARRGSRAGRRASRRPGRR